MRKLFVTALMLVALAALPLNARADTVGAAAGAGTGLLVAGPIGAVAGGIIGAVYGKPFWGPSISRAHCWTDNSFRRHCRKRW